MDLDKRFGKSLDEIGVPPGSRCLVALSGGGDSVALLELLSGQRKRLDLEIRAARIVHGIRTAGEEEAENDLCGLLCRERNVPFEVVDVSDSLRGGNAPGRGPEQDARSARHRALERLSEDSGADLLLFGHTADDQLETVMMRLLSGAGPEGLKGIDRRNGRIARPLLFAAREELRIFLEERNIPWAEDRTNDGDEYRRNRVRNELLPCINGIFPGWPSALATLAERSKEASEALRAAQQSLLPVEIAPDSHSWEAVGWLVAPSYLKALAFWTAADDLDDSGIPDRRIPWKTVKAARDAMDQGHRWNSRGLVARREEGRIRLEREATLAEGRIVLSRDEAAEGFEAVLCGTRIRVSPLESEQGAPRTVSAEDWPLEIRFTREGESVILGTGTITDKSSGHSFADADEEIFYISIERALGATGNTEGNDA